ncbi:hypothetical protein Acr_29g0001140 [Actinidia rufa]|uniref:Uncharacterized protein n=1 Tax=Actinidia rufa TaxID=165716 RepID=A0A7J0HD67_9ERIC|nr:hypothetical protein Acr_29g0001140 [Actinidia rufa]
MDEIPWISEENQEDPHGGGSVNVGVREDTESHIDLVHEGFGEIVHLGELRTLSTEGPARWRCKAVRLFGEPR